MPHLVVAERLQVVPERVLERVLVGLLVKLDKALCKEPVELIEQIFLLDTAVDQDFYNFSFLLFL